MSINNLADQICWLLSLRPFVPPAPSTPILVQEFSYDTEEEAAFVAQIETTLPAEHVPGSLESENGHRDPGRQVTNSIPSIPKDTPEMARLRVAPSPGRKPRLLAQNSCPLPACPSSTALADEKDTNRRWHSGVIGKAIQPVRDIHESVENQTTPPNIRKTFTNYASPKTSKSRIDTLDLSGDLGMDEGERAVDGRQSSYTRPKEGPKRETTSPLKLSKKRKSQEYELDQHQTDCSPRKRALPSNTNTRPAPGFVALDAVVDDPPPPYSSIVQQVRDDYSRYYSQSPEGQEHNSDEASPNHMGLRTVLKEGHLSADGHFEIGKFLPIACPENSAVRMQDIQSISRHVTDYTPAAQITGKWQRTDTPLSLDKSGRNAVADSEDEDMLARIETQSDAGFDNIGAASIHSAHEHRNLGITSSPRNMHTTVGDASEPNAELQVYKHDRSGGTSSPTCRPHTSSSLTYSEKVKRVSFDGPNSTCGQEFYSLFPMELSDDDPSLISFSLWSSSDIQNELNRLSLELRTSSEIVVAALIDTGIKPPALYEISQQVRTKFRAFQNLIEARQKHGQVSERKRELKRKLVAAVEDGREPDLDSADVAETRAVAQDLREAEAKMKSLIEQSGLDVNSCSGGRTYGKTDCTAVAVHSTQMPQYHDNATLHTLADSGIAHTQFIQQTQSPSPWMNGPPRVAKPSGQLHHNSPPKSRNTPLASTRGRKDFTAYPEPFRMDSKLPGPFKAHPRPPNVTAEHNVKSGQSLASIPQIGKRGNFCERGRSRLDDQAQEFYEDEFDDEEALFSTIMGSPPARMEPDDDDYGAEEDDEDMLEIAVDMEFQRPLSSRTISTRPRDVLTESSGNMVRNSGGKGSSIASQTTHMAPPIVSDKAGFQFPWSADVKSTMRRVFHLHGFRPNQLDAINATLDGKDVFVLMPTGGGKSLCYQLPAVIKSGRTRGVTIVISPLLSLMEDQTSHLKKLGIQAVFINSEVSRDERRLVMDSLRGPNPDQFIQLLYVTPEMLSKSNNLVSALLSLHSQKRLARIVIDEAHCVSQWGHDFRPDYKALGEVRQQFHGVPVMALTATATANVKVDVMHNLNIERCAVFTQSFNRPGLTYEVCPKGKGKDALDSIAKTINGKYRNQCGIVYCLSRKKCEDIAMKLVNEHGIKAHHYHAGMKSAEKTEVQRNWQAGEIHVIVATIAFGMGIDKPDVRFVIHHSIPKSLEGYYQETGRAGRDGKRSGCYLYYGFQDFVILKRMIEEGDGSLEQRDRQISMLKMVVQFCENRSDCRRAQVLNYFSEPFKKGDCNATCDNCNSNSVFETRDFTDYAASALRLVKQMHVDKVTLLQCVDVFRGGKLKKTQYQNLDEYGVGEDLDRNEAERLFHRLIAEDALKEENLVNKAGFATQYLHLGRNFSEFSKGNRRVQLQIRISPDIKSKKSKEPIKKDIKKRGTAPARHEYPLSTNISSPVQAASKRRLSRRADDYEDGEDQGLQQNGYSRDSFVVSDQLRQEDYDDNDNDAFEPVREAGRPRKRHEKSVGEPITVDEKLESLNQTHRMVVEDFLVRAKNECQKILFAKNLRAAPFTDTILREMAITFPKSPHELLEIPGIDPDKVELYAGKFLPLIRNAEKGYENLMRANEDRPIDPNHRTVVDLVSDDEEAAANAFDPDDFDSSPEQRSGYFNRKQDPHVAAFNAQYQQAQSERMAHPAPPRSFHDGPKARNIRAEAYGNSNKSNRHRKPSSGFSQARGGGISKRKFSGRKTSTSKSGRSADFHDRPADASRGGGGGGQQRTFGNGGIGMMPT